MTKENYIFSLHFFGWPGWVTWYWCQLEQRQGQLAQVFLTRWDAFVVQTGHIIEPLVLHVLRSSTHDIWHCGIGVLQPRHQPLGTAVTLKGIASQVPAGEEYCISGQINKANKQEGTRKKDKEEFCLETWIHFHFQIMKRKAEGTICILFQHLQLYQWVQVDEEIPGQCFNVVVCQRPRSNSNESIQKIAPI